ncbi:metallophosphoesterase [Candidatus Bipolaricaulota bacterium]|nr:metallophosphoesterase [Candidatus Bipolaricaulota bacterium]
MAWILLLALFFPSFAWEITVAFTTDLHAALPRLEALAPVLREADLILDAGDAWEDLTRLTGPSQAWTTQRMMATLGYKAMVLGNHEMYLGPLLLQLLSDAPFPVVVTNVEGEIPVLRWLLLEAKGVRVLILGALWEEYPWPLWPKVKFTDPKESLPAALKEAPEHDLLIVLGHMDFARAKALAGVLQECSLFILGHNHRFLEEPIWVGKVPIVQAGHHGEALGWARLGPEGLRSYELIKIPQPQALPNFWLLPLFVSLFLVFFPRVFP